ncbi:MAG: hypothetical protein H6532_09910, partial [Thermoleophilales bacterium]|nr:hypothetical protein [Thermoleophilales bacterium]
LANDAGFIPVDSFFRSTNLPEVFSAGVSIAVAPPEKTQVPAGVPKTGQMSETMAKVAAENIVADLEGRARWEMPMDELAAICVLDAGNNGIIFKAEHVLDKTKDPDAHIIAGPQAHWAKLAFERIFLSSRKRGHVVL